MEIVTYIILASVSVVLPSKASPAVALGGGNFGGKSGKSSPLACLLSLSCSNAETSGSSSAAVDGTNKS